VRRPAAIALLLVLLAAACGERSTGSSVDTGIRGVVLAGPQCPVETAESPCPDVPVPDLTVRVSTTAGEMVAEDVTDAEGRFEVSVEPGDYVAQAVVDAGGPTSAKPVDVTVPPDGFAQVTLPVDTGIR
jgi:hypothetical protein